MRAAMRVIRHTDPDTFLAAAAPMSDRGAASAGFFTGRLHFDFVDAAA
jgi:hypothetical protein